MPKRDSGLTALFGCTLAALGLSLAGCMSYSRATADVDRTPIVNTGTRASIIYPGQSVPMPGLPSTGAPAAGTAPQPQAAPAGTTTGQVGDGQPGQSGTPPQPGGATASQTAAPEGDGMTFIGGARMDEQKHIDVREDPLMVKYLTAPLALLAAPFVLAKEALEGDPEPGPAIPQAAAPTRPPAPAPSAPSSQPPDYETAMLQNMERELDQRQASQQAVEPAHSPGRRPSSPPPSIADELKDLQRTPELPSDEGTRSAASPDGPSRQDSAAGREDPFPTADGIVDRNGDGRIDQWIFRTDGDIVRQVLDEDFDGRPDRTLKFDEQSHQLSRVEEDTNQDGVLDSFTEYRDGAIERRRSDADGDGVVDTWSYFRKGQLARHEQDTDGDGFRDTVSFFENGARVREERDGDGDGRPEIVLHYDANEQLIRQEEDRDGDGSADVVSHYVDGHLSRRELLDSALAGAATDRSEAAR